MIEERMIYKLRVGWKRAFGSSMDICSMLQPKCCLFFFRNVCLYFGYFSSSTVPNLTDLFSTRDTNKIVSIHRTVIKPLWNVYDWWNIWGVSLARQKVNNTRIYKLYFCVYFFSHFSNPTWNCLGFFYYFSFDSEFQHFVSCKQCSKSCRFPQRYAISVGLHLTGEFSTNHNESRVWQSACLMRTCFRLSPSCRLIRITLSTITSNCMRPL